METEIKEEKPAENNQNKGGNKFLSFVWEIVKVAIIAFIIVAPIRYFLFQPFIVSGASMAPNFATGDYLIINEISYRFSNPQRGDVIVFDASFIPGYSGQRFIKRVIGLPGETIEVINGEVEIIKGTQTTVLKEKYLPENLKTFGDKKVTLASDEFFVMGDNRMYSYDSRMWGVVHKKYIIGSAFLRLFPLTAVSVIPHPSY